MINNALLLLQHKVSSSPVQTYLFPTAATDGLLSGNLGKVVYDLTLAKSTGDTRLYQTGLNLLLAIINRIGQENGLRDFSLGSGLTGLGMTITYLEDYHLVTDYAFDDLLAEIDTNVATNALKQLDWYHTDFLYGAGGQLYYLARRIRQRPKVETLLPLLVSKINEYKIADEYGIRFWNTPYFRMSETDRHDSINFSLSHGLPGFLLVLLHLQQNCSSLALEEIIREGIRFILRYRSASPPKGVYNLFPASVNLRIPEQEYTKRLAWCYGDGNILLLLYMAAQVLNEEEYSKKADEIGIKVVQRKISETTANTDSHFCHGTTGIACLYKTLFERSGQAMYEEAYYYWLSVSYRYFEEDIRSGSFAEEPTALLSSRLGAELVLRTADKGNMQWTQLFLL